MARVRMGLHHLLVVLALALAGLISVPGPLVAQTTPTATTATTTTTPATTGIDYAQWERQAWVAEALLDNGGISDMRLNELRASMARWRERFQTAQNPNPARMVVLKGQLDALGPVPAEGETEPPEVTARRSELTAALAQEQAPVLRAAEAFGRADGIIQQIDMQLRERKANALMHLSPSPVVPARWAAALGESGTWLRAAIAETRTHIQNLPADYLYAQMPRVLLLVVLAAVLLTLGRGWVQGLPQKLGAYASANAREAVAFLTSLLQIALPYAGVHLAVMAIETSALFGSYFSPLARALPDAALVWLVGRWVAVNLFSAEPGAPPARLRLAENGARSMRTHGTALAAMLGLFTLATPSILPLGGLRVLGERVITPPQPFTEASAAVWHMPLMLLTSVLLYRLGSVLRHCMDDQPPDNIAYRYRVAAGVGALSRLVALVAPVLAMLGYVAAGNSLLWPWLDTLGLMGLVMLAQKFVDDLWTLIKGGEEHAQKALAPVLIGFALVLLAMPLLALIWGARPADLGEAWLQMRGGLNIAGIRISPMAMLTFAIVFGVVFLLTRMVQAAIGASILPKTKLDPGAQNAIVSGLGYVGIFLAALMAITSAGIDLSSLAIVAGALSVGIGFGLQNIVSNFVSGIILLIERPVAVGDWIQVGEQQGIVRRISVRSTIIQTFDRADMIVPNSDLISNLVTNFTHQSMQGRVVVPVTVGFDADTRLVEELLLTIAEEQPLVLIDPAPSVLFLGFVPSGLEFNLRVIVSDILQGFTVGSDIRHQIVARFREAGVILPGSTHSVRVLGPGTDGDAKMAASVVAAATEAES